MRISDLSRESGVPIPTIKFYLREGIVAPGERTAHNQARYDERHLRRLRLVRVLVEVGGLSLAAVRRVLDALADETRPINEVLGVAHRAIDEPWTTHDPAARTARDEIDAWIRARGWQVSADAPARETLATTLAALRGLGWDVGPRAFDRYAGPVEQIAADELAYVAATDTREAAVEATVVGTVVFERAMIALRRLAQEDRAARRLGR